MTTVRLPCCHLRPLALVAGVVVALGMAACDGDAEPDAATGCAATVRDASQAVEVDEQVSLLDLALSQCVSPAALIGEMSRYPGIVGYSPATFVELRCTTATDDAVQGSAVCRSYRAPSTTVAVVAPSAVYVAETLDGRSIEITPNVDVAFVGDVPEPMQRTVDIAVEQGCIGVIAQRDQWAAQVADPVIGDLASAYAKHAENVASYIRCVFDPLAAPPPTSPGSTAP